MCSRTGVEQSKRFDGVAEAIAALSDKTLVLDGEIAIFDQAAPVAVRLAAPPSHLDVATPPIYIAFDVLYRNGQDLTELPLSARRIHPGARADLTEKRHKTTHG